MERLKRKRATIRAATTKLFTRLEEEMGKEIPDTNKPECLGERRLRGRLSAVDHRTQSMAADQEVDNPINPGDWVYIRVIKGKNWASHGGRDHSKSC
ncbi:uncharacterized protein ACBT44_018015 isoform 2-T2 [Syngnathus typhle]